MDEKEVCKELNISDYKTYFSVPKNRQSFAQIVPVMNPKYAKRMMQNFPIILEYVDNSLVTARGILNDMAEADKESFLPVYDNYSKIIDTCLEKCKDGNISSDLQMEYMNKAIEVGILMSKKDTENKRFKWLNLRTVLSFVGIGAAATIGYILASSKDENESNMPHVENEDDIIDADTLNDSHSNQV